MKNRLAIEHVRPAGVNADVARSVQRLCDDAYRTSTAPFFASLGPGDHLLGRRDGALVSHLMWITRWLEPAGHMALKTAYVEMVATAPAEEGQGYASALLEHVLPLVSDYDVAALCPASEGLYARLGWVFWRGPLSARRDGRVVATPEERVMIHTLPRTPALDLDAPLSVEWRPGEVW